jgi:penicillin amidase
MRLRLLMRATVPSAAMAAALAIAGFLPAASPLGITLSAARRPHTAASGERVGTRQESAVISRNSYGVPSITASAMPGVWFGAGYAQAEDRLVQLELTRRDVEGTLAAVFGSAELAQDENTRNFYYTPTEMLEEYRTIPPGEQQALQEYSDGINAFLARAYSSPANEKAMVPYEFFLLGQVTGLKGPYRPGPWHPVDTLAIGNFLARDFGGGGGAELSNASFLRYLVAELAKKKDANATTDAMAIFNDSRWINDPTAPTTVPSTGAAPSDAAASPSVKRQTLAATASSFARLSKVSNGALLRAEATLARDRKLILSTGVSLKVISHGGSDAFAVAPWRSADHHALLWGAPQEGFGTPSVDGEEYLHGPSYDAGGMYITGEPFILIGRNSSIAWTTTSEELVDQRVYMQKVRFSPSPEYWFDHSWWHINVIHEEINVAGSKPRPYTVYRTIDGPIFSIDLPARTVFAMRFASWGKEAGTLTGFAQFGGDTTLTEFEHSVSLVTTLHNFLYADKAGNIAFFGAGLVPIEPSYTKVDPRLPAIGDGTEQWLGFVPRSAMPTSINPAQGYLDNWNTKPSASLYYQQNGGDEYWGTIYRSSRIAQLLSASKSINIAYLESIEHDIGQIDNGDNTRPAGVYFIPYLKAAYTALKAANSPLTNPATHPDLAAAMADLESWNGDTTLGSPAMSIFMNFLEALERNVFEGGEHSGEQYTGAVNFSDSSLGMGTYGGLGGFATYNFLYHVISGTTGLVPCDKQCFSGHYFNKIPDQILIESVNDAITILSGKGTQLGQNVPGFGTTDVAKWGYKPALDTNWNNLDQLALFVKTTCGISPSQNRSTYMQAIDISPSAVVGYNVLPPGQSGFINQAKQPSPHFCDQVGLFNSFQYKGMPTIP